MASQRTIKRIDNLVWALIFGGLFTVVFGFVLDNRYMGPNWYVIGCGAAATLAGAVLIYVRSRLTQDS